MNLLKILAFAKDKKKVSKKPNILFTGKIFIDDRFISFKDLEGLTDNFKLPLSFIDHIREKHKDEWHDFNIHE